MTGNSIHAELPRVMLVGTGSGSGKTTMACAILKAMKDRGLAPASFKCGPDYIDPMFHSRVIGAKSRNLDMYLCGEKTVGYLFGENAKGADFSLIEGVMGMYDGLGATDHYSSNSLALATDTPEVLVVNTKGKSLSLIAQLAGYLNFAPNSVKGVILNNTTDGMYGFYKDMIESRLNVKVYGYMPEVSEAVFHSRHLGLVTAAEIQDIQRKLDALAKACARTVDIDGLLALGRAHAAFSYEDIPIEPACPLGDVCVAVAMDKAFCFYYEDNFTLLKKLGARIEFFSPLEDDAPPAGADGFIFGGGYPEEHAGALAANAPMLRAVKEAAISGVPVIAECGGFMYLCETLTDREGAAHPMAGVIATECRITDKLSRQFGYVRLRANEDNMLCRAGEGINAHEFHYSASSDEGGAFTAAKENGKSWACVHAGGTIFAGYPHMHLWGNPGFARRFIMKCKETKDEYRTSGSKR